MSSRLSVFYNKDVKEKKSMEKILVIENISKYYGNKSNLTKAINNLSMSIDEGDLWPLWGPVVLVKQLC